MYDVLKMGTGIGSIAGAINHGFDDLDQKTKTIIQILINKGIIKDEEEFNDIMNAIDIANKLSRD